MKKNLIIIILTLISLASLTYGYMQKLRAAEQQSLVIEYMGLAKEAAQRAEQNRAVAEQQRMVAEMAMANAEAQRDMARQAQLEGSRK